MSSPTWSSINQRMRSLDLKLKDENDSNRRCSFDKLMQVNGERLLMDQEGEGAGGQGSLKEDRPSPPSAGEQMFVQQPEQQPLPLIKTTSQLPPPLLPPLRPTNLPISQPIDILHERNAKSAESAPAELLLPPGSASSHLLAPTVRSADHTMNTLSHILGGHKRNLPALSTGNLGILSHRSSAGPKSAELKSAPTPTSGGSLNFTLNQSIRSTCSSFIDRISARLNGSLNFASNRTQSFPITGADTTNAHTLSPSSQDSLDSLSGKNLSPSHLRSSSAKMNGNERLDTSSSPINLGPFPPSLNAQCLSPRPRLKALPINFANGRNRSPSRSQKPLQPLFSSPNSQTSRFDSAGNLQPKNDNNITLRDKFRQNNNVLSINNQKYHCQESDFRYIEELGSGSCGHVAKMEHIPSRSIIAVKQMRRSGDDEESKRIIMDLDVLLKCHDCDNIVQCYGYLIKDAEVWIFMELMVTCLDKLLRKLKKPFPEKICGKVAVASVKALNYLKDNHSVIHRDVKPSNILINDKGVVKLCDFGISGRLVDSKARTRQAGCAAYMAPERIDPPDPTKPSYDIRADVWSLGISLVELAIGKFPYPECKTDFEVLSKILQADPPILPDDGTYSSYFCSFIQDCLQKDYHKRPKYHQLMCHPFILKYEREEVDVEKWFLSSIL